MTVVPRSGPLAGVLHSETETARGVRRALLRLVIVFALIPAVLLLSAGRLDWGMAWVYTALMFTLQAIALRILLPEHADLIAERSRLQPGTKSWDKVLAPVVAIVGPIATYVVAGLDCRFHWSPPMALWARLVSLGALVFGYGLVLWAMTVNRFFASTVRIQSERGHRVIQDGPYRHVRHPGYSGMLLFLAGTPLALGSFWGLVPAAVSVCLLVLRTVLEDRTLRRELEGYGVYAARVRWRLLAGVW